MRYSEAKKIPNVRGGFKLFLPSNFDSVGRTQSVQQPGQPSRVSCALVLGGRLMSQHFLWSSQRENVYQRAQARRDMGSAGFKRQNDKDWHLRNGLGTVPVLPADLESLWKEPGLIR